MQITAIAVALAAIVEVNAAIFEFDLGPNGMNGSNEAPPVFTTASGGELSTVFPEQPGISYDSSNHQLFLNLAWGSDNGFSDLVGNFGAARIFGPADEGVEAGMLYNLTPLVNPSSSGGHDAGIFGQVIELTANPNLSGFTIEQQEAQLLAGKWYINVHSSFLPTGEIRGQLVPVPEPRTYGMVAAIALLAFAICRKHIFTQANLKR